MPPSSLTCTTCCVLKSRRAFLRPFKQRIIVEKVCDSCRAAALLKDSTGRKLQRAIERGDVTDIEGKRLRAQLEALRAQREAARRAKISVKIARLHTDRRRYGEDLPKEQARRKKISATLTGRKRGPYLKAKDRI